MLNTLRYCTICEKGVDLFIVQTDDDLKAQAYCCRTCWNMYRLRLIHLHYTDRLQELNAIRVEKAFEDAICGAPES